MIAKLREDILNPIPGDNPSGQSVRLTPVYDRIREARREDDALAQGAWQIERKVADHSLAIKLVQDVLATQSKDLQLAAWLCDSLLRRDGIAGLRDGITLCRALLDRFWDTLYPQVEEGEFDDRLAPVEWISSKLLIPIKSVPLCRAGYNFFEYKNSRGVEYEDLAKSKDQKAAREKALKDGKLASGAVRQVFRRKPQSILRRAGETIRCRSGGCADSGPNLRRQIWTQGGAVIYEIAGNPSGSPAHRPPIAPEEARNRARSCRANPAASGRSRTGAEIGARQHAGVDAGPGDCRSLGRAGTGRDHRRRRRHTAKAGCLQSRAIPHAARLAVGRAPRRTRSGGARSAPSELRQQIKRLAMDNNWRELLELAENVMALPCSRAWLDLQRFVIEACAALGEDYSTIAIAIRSEDPDSVARSAVSYDATLNDDTPAANGETQAWLRDLLSEPVGAPISPDTQRLPTEENSQPAGWRKKYVDAHVLACKPCGQARR